MTRAQCTPKCSPFMNAMMPNGIGPRLDRDWLGRTKECLLSVYHWGKWLISVGCDCLDGTLDFYMVAELRLQNQESVVRSNCLHLQCITVN